MVDREVSTAGKAPDVGALGVEEDDVASGAWHPSIILAKTMGKKQWAADLRVIVYSCLAEFVNNNSVDVEGNT
jgi:predicted lipoprotein with Yx(FWY)xxD motif